MERFAILVTLFSALVFVSDANFFAQQEAVLEAFQHVFQHNLFNIDLYNESMKFKLDTTKYDDPHVFETFWRDYEKLNIRDEYSVCNKNHVNAFASLYKMFMSAKDLPTLYQAVAWAKYHVDPYIYMYALTVAIEHRPDMKDVFVPAVFEINPYFFFNSIVIEEAISQQMQGYDSVKKEDGVYTVVIPSNYTGRYVRNQEQSILSYFTEDPAINAAFYKLHTLYPYWMTGENMERRSPLFAKFFQHILARYYMERLSNNLGHVPEFSWTDILETGYTPDIRYYGGVQFPSRGDYYKLYNKHTYEKLDLVKSLESRIRLDFNEMSPEVIHKSLLEYFYLTRSLLASSDYTQVPGAMMHYETSMRDPIFYQFVKRFLGLLPYADSYKRDDIIFEGVKIDSVEMDKLITYFENFDFDITNAVDVNGIFDKSTGKSPLVNAGRVAQYHGEDFLIKARQSRLNHLVFNYKLHVHSDKAQKVKILMFLGPKYDEFGNTLSLHENRENFYEMDSVTVDLTEGDNLITRSCKDFPSYAQDHTTFYEMSKQLLLARKGEYKYPAKKPSGFPWRMMLPKGKKEGLPVQFFFFITPATDKFIDNQYIRRFSYPLDRKIDEEVWYTPNMYYFDTLIYHKKE